MQENYQDMEKLRTELRMTRIFNIITSLLLICVLMGGFMVFREVKQYADAAMPFVEKLAVQLEQLDVDALNEAVAGLNMEELSEALENLNNATETLENFAATIKNFFSKFGGL